MRSCPVPSCSTTPRTTGRAIPYARGTWNHFRPGQIMRYETALRATEGRLVFAGSHTALLWPGFIDGAVESGLRAGAEAAALLA